MMPKRRANSEELRNNSYILDHEEGPTKWDGYEKKLQIYNIL